MKFARLWPDTPMQSPTRLVPVASLLVVLGACGRESSTPITAAAANKAQLPAMLALAAEPPGARPVKDVVREAKSGDEVVVAGRVGVEGSDRAYFTLVDPSLQACSETPLEDPCKTPWDFCCTPPDELSRLSALIEFRDGAGLHPGSVLGFDGLDHLKNVVVKGKADKDGSGNLTVVASGIYVRK